MAIGFASTFVGFAAAFRDFASGLTTPFRGLGDAPFAVAVCSGPAGPMFSSDLFAVGGLFARGLFAGGLVASCLLVAALFAGAVGATAADGCGSGLGPGLASRAATTPLLHSETPYYRISTSTSGAPRRSGGGVPLQGTIIEGASMPMTPSFAAGLVRKCREAGAIAMRAVDALEAESDQLLAKGRFGWPGFGPLALFALPPPFPPALPRLPPCAAGKK